MTKFIKDFIKPFPPEKKGRIKKWLVRKGWIACFKFKAGYRCDGTCGEHEESKNQ